MTEPLGRSDPGASSGDNVDRLGRALWRIGLIGAALTAGLTSMLAGLVAAALCCASPAIAILAGGTAAIGVGAGILAWAGDASGYLIPPLILFSAMAACGGLRLHRRGSASKRCRISAGVAPQLAGSARPFPRLQSRPLRSPEEAGVWRRPA